MTLSLLQRARCINNNVELGLCLLVVNIHRIPINKYLCKNCLAGLAVCPSENLDAASPA